MIYPTHTSGLFDTDLSLCNVCPRNCNVNRNLGQNGYCKSGSSSGVVSVCIHKGEEPCFSGDAGLCNVFFGRCNLQCVYCQNIQISKPDYKAEIAELNYDEVVRRICDCLDQGCHALGFVSPSHQVPQMKRIIGMLNQMGRYPTIIYNSNGYDKPETLRSLEGMVDVYLPDFKYSDEELARSFSGVSHYTQTVLTAIGEMIRQKGRVLITDENEIARSGILIRHLVLPGYIENSLGVLNLIADNFSPRIPISLMSQYYPMPGVAALPGLNRYLTVEEYGRVVAHMQELGMDKGYIQEMESSDYYLPDFTGLYPFESKTELKIK
ncbi:radical SAM protein [Lentimicrobium sp.]